MFVLKKASKGSAAAWKQARAPSERADTQRSRVTLSLPLSVFGTRALSRAQTRKQVMTMGAYCVAVRFAYLVCNWGR